MTEKETQYQEVREEDRSRDPLIEAFERAISANKKLIDACDRLESTCRVYRTRPRVSILGIDIA